MKKLIYLFATAALLTTTACGDDKKEPEDIKGPSGEMEQMTPKESKVFLQETAVEVMEKFRAADQRPAITIAKYFSEEYGDLDAPKEFEVEAEETVNPASQLMKTLAATLDKLDASGLGTAVITYTYDLNFSRFAGIYEPGIDRWVHSGTSDDIIFRFKDNEGKQCELKAVASKGTSDGEITTTDEYYDWAYDDYVNEKYVYKYKIPKEVTVTLNNGTEIMKAIVTSDIDLDGHKLSAQANVKVCNIDAAVKIDGTDAAVNMTSSMAVSGETLLTATATVNGAHLCDYDYYKDFDDDSENKLVGLLKNGTATVSLYDKVRVDGTAAYNRDIYKAFNTDYDAWEYNTQADAEEAIKKAVETLNSNITAEVRYNNKETVQATLLWKYEFDKWGSGWEYTFEPLLKFPSDDTTYSFDEYFETGFSTVEDTWSDLIKSYEKVWDSVK